jgi:hypothetical protein
VLEFGNLVMPENYLGGVKAACPVNPECASRNNPAHHIEKAGIKCEGNGRGTGSDGNEVPA